MLVTHQEAGWALLAIITVLVELHSRTVYLLALAGALVLATGLAWGGIGTDGQLWAIAATCLVGFPLAVWYRRRMASRSSLLDADVGQQVQVIHVRPSGGLRVSYRGTEWDADCAGPPPQPGDHLRIARIHGTSLELTRR